MRNYGRNPYGGSYRLGGGGAIPPGVKILLIANISIYVLQMISGDFLVRWFGLTPTDIFLSGPSGFSSDGLYINTNPAVPLLYQLVTYMFLHGGFFHILMNMFVLWMFGGEIERAWGKKRFFRYYFMTGIAGGIFTVIFQPYFSGATIGASASVYGLLVAYAVLFPNRLIYLYFLIPVKVKYAVIAFVGLEFYASLSTANDGIGHLAHLGGAIIGFIYLKFDYRVNSLISNISPFGLYSRLRYRKKTVKMEKNRLKTEEVMKRVDEILDKINEVGLENISEEDRRFLGSASDVLAKKDK